MCNYFPYFLNRLYIFCLKADFAFIWTNFLLSLNINFRTSNKKLSDIHKFREVFLNYSKFGAKSIITYIIFWSKFELFEVNDFNLFRFLFLLPNIHSLKCKIIFFPWFELFPDFFRRYVSLNAYKMSVSTESEKYIMYCVTYWKINDKSEHSGFSKW